MDLHTEILKTLKVTDQLWQQKRRLDELKTNPFDGAYDEIMKRMRKEYARLECAAQSIPGNQYTIGENFNIKLLG